MGYKLFAKQGSEYHCFSLAQQKNSRYTEAVSSLSVKSGKSSHGSRRKETISSRRVSIKIVKSYSIKWGLTTMPKKFLLGAELAEELSERMYLTKFWYSAHHQGPPFRFLFF